MNEMLMKELAKERQALLALELCSMGVDVRRLGFLRWLKENGHDPEWMDREGDYTFSI